MASVRLSPLPLSLPTPAVLLESNPIPKSKHSFKPRFIASHRASSFKILCIKKDKTHNAFQLLQDFSILKTEFPCDSGSVWSTLAFYIFSLHIPLSFGGLSVVAYLLHQTVLDPDIQALSLLLLETLELVGFFLLLRHSENPYNVLSFFEAKELPKERNWLLASVLGLGFLLLLIFITSIVADKLIGPKDGNAPIVKAILSSGSISAIACTLLYCFVAPLLEEIVYRGFLLTSLTSTMEWHKALVISSAVFSAAHFSVDNFLQLFAIGYVLGCSYCWTGTLISPIVIHSLYNAFTLVITFSS